MVFCLLMASAVRLHAGTASRSDTPLQLDKETTIPFEYFNQHIFVTLTVNGTPDIVFMFDTGTSANILNLRTSQRLGLKPDSVKKEKDLGLGQGKVSVAAAKDVDVKMGDVRIANVLAIVDLHGLEQVNGHPIDGILGFPLLRHYVVDLDFQNRMLTLHPVKGYQYQGSGDILFLRHKKYSAAVPVVLGTDKKTQHTATLEIDTGSDATVLLYSKFVEQSHMMRNVQQPYNAKVYGLGGYFPVELASLRFLHMGHSEVTPLTVFFMQTTPMLSSMRKIGGVVGTSVLDKYQKIIFDVPSGRIILEHELTNKELEENAKKSLISPLLH